MKLSNLINASEIFGMIPTGTENGIYVCSFIIITYKPGTKNKQTNEKGVVRATTIGWKTSSG